MRLHFYIAIIILSLTTSNLLANASLTTKNITIQNSSIEEWEKDFNFDWNNYSTIEKNQKKMSSLEVFLKSLPADTQLSAKQKHDLGKLLYKLGTFYTHIAREPDLAINKMLKAKKLLNTQQEQAWNNNHLAYAYEQKYAASGLLTDKKKALSYTNKVTGTHQANKAVAFAYCVNGLVFNDAKDYKQAENNFNKAFHLYEKMPDGKDDQYARAKNRLANIILDQQGRDQEALAILKNLKHYWQAKGNMERVPYAARNEITLGQAYLKTNQFESARNEFQAAISSYEKIYGNHHQQLVKPYQLLAETYQKLGDEKQAAIYLKKSQQAKS